MAMVLLFDRQLRFSQAILAVRYPDTGVIGNSWLLNAGLKEAALQCHRHTFFDYKQLQRIQLHV